MVSIWVWVRVWIPPSESTDARVCTPTRTRTHTHAHTRTHTHTHARTHALHCTPTHLPLFLSPHLLLHKNNQDCVLCGCVARGVVGTACKAAATGSQGEDHRSAKEGATPPTSPAGAGLTQTQEEGGDVCVCVCVCECVCVCVCV